LIRLRRNELIFIPRQRRLLAATGTLVAKKWFKKKGVSDRQVEKSPGFSVELRVDPFMETLFTPGEGEGDVN